MSIEPIQAREKLDIRRSKSETNPKVRWFWLGISLLFTIWVGLIIRAFFSWGDWLFQLERLSQVAGASGLIALLLLFLSLGVAAGMGRWLLARLACLRDIDSLERSLFSTALGLGIIAYVTFLVGILQLYYVWVFRFLLVVATLILLPFWRRAWRASGEAISYFRSGASLSKASLGGKMQWGTSLLLGVYGAIALVVALSPETEFDALNYHLGIPRLYLANHGVQGIPHLFYSNFPLSVEMLFTFGWLVHSVILSKLFHFALGALVAGAIVLFCRRYYLLPVGLLAATLFLASPIVLFLFKTAMVDLGLTLFIFLTLYAYCLWVQFGRHQWLVLSAVFSGLALATKYTGMLSLFLVTVATLLLVICPGCLSDGRTLWVRLSAAFRSLCLYYVVASVVFAPWLLKNLFLVGNPIAPFLSDLFHNPNFRSTDYLAWLGVLNDWGGYAGSVWDYLRFPWLMTHQALLFMGTPGPVYLMFFPLAVLLGWRQRTTALLAFWALLGFGFLLLGTHQVRFYVPLFPLLSIVISASLVSWYEKSDSGCRLLAGAVVVLLLILVVLQLPYFTPLWQQSTVLSLKPASIKLFGSYSQRDVYRATRLGGEDSLSLYEFLEEKLPQKTPILALAVAYQALSDHPIYMAPNCSPATQLTDDVIQTSLRTNQLSTIRLQISHSQWRRHWKIRLPEIGEKHSLRFHRPRLFYRQDGGLLEIHWFKVQTDWQQGELEIILDLGLPRRLDEVRLLTQSGKWGPERPLALLFAAKGENWQDAVFSLRVERPEGLSLDQLEEKFRHFNVAHLLYQKLPELDFIDAFFSDRQVRRHFPLLARVGQYRVHRLAD